MSVIQKEYSYRWGNFNVNSIKDFDLITLIHTIQCYFTTQPYINNDYDKNNTRINHSALQRFSEIYLL